MQESTISDGVDSHELLGSSPGCNLPIWLPNACARTWKNAYKSNLTVE